MKDKFIMKSDDTIVLGWDKNHQASYCKTFFYDDEKEAAQLAIKYVSENCPGWKVGHLSGFIIEDAHNHFLESERDPPICFTKIPQP